MNNNTVVMDLERYDEMTEELRTLKETVKNILGELKNNLAIPRDCFVVEEEYGMAGDAFVLKIDAKTIEKIMANFAHYDYEIKYGDHVKISDYQLTITEKVVEVDEE